MDLVRIDLERCDWTSRLRPAKRYLLGFILGALALAPSSLGQAPGQDASILSPPNVPSGPTGGIKPSQAADDTFFEIVFSGGPLGVGIMIALILMSILAMYLVIDQWLTLRRKDLIPNELNENVRQLLSQGKLKEDRKSVV